MIIVKNIVRAIRLLFKTAPLLMIMLGLLTTLSLFVSPLFSLIDKYLFDTLQDNTQHVVEISKIIYIIGLYFFYNFFVFLLFKLINIVSIYTQTIVNAALQKETMNRINNVEYERFEDSKFYDYMTTVNNEISGGNILSIFSNIITFISVIGTTIYLGYLLLDLSIWAVIVSIVCCIPGFLHQATFGKKNWEFNTSKIPLQRKMGYYFFLLSSIQVYRENRIYGTIPKYKEKYSSLFDDYYQELKEFNSKNCWKGVLMATLHTIGTVSVILFAYIQAAYGNITLGDAVLFVGVSQSIYNNIQNAIYTFGSINTSRHSVNNLLDFLSMSKGVNAKINDCVYDVNNPIEIELSNITFSYPHTQKTVLEGLDLKIKKGEKLALVGENGSGKTTLAKIILGLYSPQSGKVKINGIDSINIPKSDKYGSACFQDFCTYSFSIRENVAFGDITKLLCDDSLNRAIDMSCLDRKSFDNNVDSQLTKLFDSNGVVLSGGQLQKLALARSFLFEEGFLILDEPSASLDVRTEYEIFSTVLKLLEGKTSIVITHRLANVVHCDRIVYLESGKICEEGTHRELMDKNGKYAELFRTQAEKYLL